MVYSVKFYKKAEKDLSKLSNIDKERVIKALLFLQNNPQSGKKLKGKFEGYYSLRVWPFRVIYFIKNNFCIIFIIRIGHRKDIYKNRG